MRLRSILAATVLAGSTLLTQAESKTRFFTPQELADHGEKSEVSYATTIVSRPEELPTIRQAQAPNDVEFSRLAFPRIIEERDGTRTLVATTVTENTLEALTTAEPLFDRDQYDEARAIYEAALLSDPTSHVLLSHVGDCLLLSDQAEQALEYYDKSIKINPDDFHGYWYRASAQFALKRYEDARLSYSRALAMAPFHQEILQTVKSRSELLNIQEVRENGFSAQATARAEGEVYRNYTVDKTYWWLYGLCKAVWLAEEDHRLRLTGRAAHNWSSTEELECLGVLLARYKSMRDSGGTQVEPQLDVLLKVLEAGLLGEFISYQFGSKITPHFTILLPTESQEQIAGYVSEFVLVRAE